MPYRIVATPQPPPEADIDTPEMVEAALAVDRDDEDVLMLKELAEIGMRLVRAHETYATARLAKVAADGSALNPGENPHAPYDKLAQTIRRTVALKKQLAEGVKTRRAGLATERAARRAKRTEDHATAVKDAIEMALNEVYHADLILPDFDPEADPYKPEPYEIERREMLDDVELLLEDVEEFGDWLTRPVGETVAKLCVALGLGSDMCAKRGDTWFVSRSKTAYETMQAEKSSRPKAAPTGVPPTSPPRDADRPLAANGPPP
jgi:hypothetical protein